MNRSRAARALLFAWLFLPSGCRDSDVEGDGTDEGTSASSDSDASSTSSSGSSSTSGRDSSTSSSSSGGSTDDTGTSTGDDETGTTSTSGTDDTSGTSGEDTGTEGGETGETDTDGSDVCGDGVVSGTEQCDMADLAGHTCQDEGFPSGDLGCMVDCTFDTAQCSMCGNNLEDLGEECDGTELGGLETCADVGLGSSSEPLTCTDSCVYDFSACTGCGDGSVNSPEECDGVDLSGQTCELQGFEDGEISCDDTCHLDVSECFSCGDGIKNGMEECDTNDVDALDCTEFDRTPSNPYDGGMLVCNADCTFDFSACMDCGDGVMTGTELCDGADVGLVACSDQSFTAGVLSCNGTCDGYDTSQCTLCGDGAAELPESCDCGGDSCTADELDLQTCESRGFDDGTLGCLSDCTFDEASCISFACGDGSINGSDQCDCGADGVCTAGELADMDCTDFTSQTGAPFTGGTLGCNSGMGLSCSFNTSSCVYCGDGTRNGNEDCEDAELGGATCQSLGFGPGGSLSCNLSCEYSTGSCNTCGNAMIDGTDECDGANLDGQTCQDLGYGPGGSLTCNSNCTFNESACNRCGNGVIDSGETCDCGGDACTAGELGNNTCATRGYASGSLTCNASCQLDVSACTGLTCNVDPTPPGGSCPAACTGGCNGTTCTIDCHNGSNSVPGPCKNATVNCPAGWNCAVDCEGHSSDNTRGGCYNADIVCPADYDCDVDCEGSHSCRDTATICSARGHCDVSCANVSGDNACTTSTLTCGGDSCAAICGDTSKPTVTCGSSCQCTTCP